MKKTPLRMFAGLPLLAARALLAAAAGEDTSGGVGPLAASSGTLAADQITLTGATLHASVNPDGTVSDVYFQYGLASTMVDYVTTLAGSGTAGFTNGIGTAARFNNPSGVAVDSSGNVYVADDNNHRIRKITPDGAVTTLAGSGTGGYLDATGTSAQFNDPYGVAVDGAGNVYVADRDNNCIRKITPAGAVSTFAGSGTAGSVDGTNTAARFNNPLGVAVDNAGNVYVADNSNGKVRKITPGGRVSTLAAGTGDPCGVAADGAGNVYVADGGYDRIKRVVPLNSVLAQSGVAGTGSVQVALSITGLQMGTTYYYRAVLTNANGTVNGSTLSFTTVSCTAPTDITLSSTQVNELRPAGTVVGAFSTSDADAGDAFTYTLVAGTGSGDNGSFSVSNGTLRTAASFTYASKSSYSVRVRSTDLGGLWVEKVFTITVVSLAQTLAADAITFTGATLHASVNPDGGPRDALFQRSVYSNMAGGVLFMAQAGLTGTNLVQVDWATTGLQPGTTYYYRAVLTNAAGTAYGQILNFTTLAYTAPTNITLSSAQVNEIRPAGAVVGAFSTADVDAGDAFTYTLVAGTGSGDNGSFSVSNGTLRTAASFTYASKSSYSVRVRSTDLGGLWVEKAFTVTVVSLAQTLAADAVTFTGAALHASVNPGGGPCDALFLLSANSNMVGGALVLAQAGLTGTNLIQVGCALTGLQPGTTYYYRAALTNAFGTAYGAILSFSTLVDFAPTDITLSAAQVIELRPAGTVVGAFSTTDADAGDAFTYTLAAGAGSDDNGAFTVSNGVLRTAASFTYALKNSYSVRLRSTDQAGLWVEKAFTIAVLPLAETLAADAITFTGATLHASVDPDGTVSDALFQYGLTPDILQDSVSTLAGSTSGYADGTNTAAQFYNPAGVAVDSADNIYVADRANNKIRKITPSGMVSTLAGSTSGYADGTNTAAQFNYPYGVAVDSAGNVFVADYNNHRIRKITPTGVVSTLAGSTSGYADGTNTAAQFNNPNGVAVDKADNIYVADRANHKIRKITPDGTVSTLAGSTSGYADGTNTAAKFNNPTGVAVDSAGNVYVTDSANHKIRRITPDGAVSTLAGSTSGYADGTNTAAKFNSPYGCAVDGAGHVIVADASNHRIRWVTPAGMVSTLAGSASQGFADGACATAAFRTPTGVALDGAGNIIVADLYNNRIRRISPSSGILAQSGLTGSGKRPVDLTLTGLQPGTTYYYRAMLTNSAGAVYGPILSFSTLAYTAPTDISLSSSHVNEIHPAGTVVGAFSSTDADAGDAFTYALAAGAGDGDNGAFSVSNGTLRTTASFTYAVKNSYSVRIRSTDKGGLWVEKAFTIAVLPLAETLAADAITYAVATLNGSVKPCGFLSSALFQYSLAPDLATPVTALAQGGLSSTGTVHVSLALTGLLSGSNYYCRVMLTNAFGTAYGEIVPFTTAVASNWTVTLTAPLAAGYPQDKQVLSGTPYGTLPTPVLFGYDFAGWWSGVGGTGVQVTSETLMVQSADHALYARFTPKSFRVTFLPGWSGATQQVANVTFGAAWPALAPQVPSGHTLAGWFTPEGLPVDLSAPVAFEANQTLLARWAVVDGGSPASFNDHFAQARMIAVFSGTVNADTSLATAQSGEPVHYATGPHHSLWWSFTAPQNGTLDIDTAGSAFDTVLALYSGTALTNLQQAAANDSAGDDAMHSRIVCTLVGGTAYYLALDGYSDTDSGAASLTWRFTSLTNGCVVRFVAPAVTGYPSNVAVAAGAPYGVLPVPARYGYTFGGWWTGSGGTGLQVTHATVVAQGATNHALYARLTPSQFRVTFDPGLSGVTQQVYGVTYGAAWPALAPQVPAGHTLDGWFTPEGLPVDLSAPVAFETNQTLLARWTATEGGTPAPLNDAFAQAHALAGLSGTTNADTALATAELLEPSHYASGPHHSLWWRFTPAQNGTLDIDTAGSAFDTVLALYAGNALSNLQQVASNDSAGDDVMHSRIVCTLTGGVTYRIALDGYSDTDSGAASLTWLFTPLAAGGCVVTFVAPPAAGFPSNAAVTAGAPYGALPLPAAFGYAFGGWWRSPGGTGVRVTNETVVAVGSTNHSLYAKLTPITSRVAFDPCSYGATQQVYDATYGAPWPAVASPTLTGYSFSGWHTAAGALVNLGVPVSFAADTTLSAWWTPAADTPLTARGTPLAWLQAYGLTAQTPELEDEEDADNDGFPAWQEYAADTNPTNRNSCLALTAVSWTGGGLRIAWKGGAEATQWLETRSSLSDTNEPWVAIFTNLPPTGLEQETLDARLAPSVRFYRIRAAR